MNILMLSTDRALFDGDSAVQLRLLEQARSAGGTIHVIVLAPATPPSNDLAIGEHLKIYPTRSTGRLSYLPDAYRIGVRILEHARNETGWLVSAQDPFELGAVALLLARKFRLPLHLQIHTDPWSIAWRNERLLNRLRFVLALFLVRRAHSIRIVAERLRGPLRALGVSDDRITKVPIHVDTATLAKAKPAFDLHRSYPGFDRIVLSIGRLQPEKNYRGLIRAFAMVRREHPEALLVIVGSGPERERLLRLARSLELEACVKILPWARDVATYYKTCDVYVQSSLYEGWGLAVIEAMASGAPVVMTDVGCAGEVLENEVSGLVVPVGDDRILARAISRLLGNRELALRLAGEAHVRVQRLASKEETMLLYKASWERALLTFSKK